MILEEGQLLNILQKNPARPILDEARKRSSLLHMHNTGEHLKEYVTSMEEYFEDEQRKNLRQKYARSNKDIFSRLHRPLDKIFSAKGGSLTYNLSKSQETDLSTYLATIRNDQPLREWVRQVALNSLLIDPNGLVFMEIDKDGVSAYPTYKATTDIFDYQRNGRKLEYVVFTLTPDQVAPLIGQETFNSVPPEIRDRMKNATSKSRYYRVVDDISDSIIEWDGTEVTEVDRRMNPFMEVPALIISPFISFNSDLSLSPDEPVVELANDVLTDVSVFNIWKKLHGFPKAWRLRSVCPTCQGNRSVGGADCPDCKGTGYRMKTTVRDEIIVPIAEEGQTLPKEFAGYVTPNIEGWKMMTEEMERLSDLMFQTFWGAPPRKETANGGDKTATEILYNQTDQVERLQVFSKWGQGIEKFVIDKVAELRFKAGYKGCSVNYGDRYVLESPDVLWEKYNKARTAGAPQATLDGLLRDYYESRYESSPVDLQKALKLMSVEPWTHLSINVLEAITTTELDKAAKIYFSEWISTKQDMEIIQTDVEALRTELYTYAQQKAQTIEQEQIKAMQQQIQADGLDTSVVRNVTQRINS